MSEAKGMPTPMVSNLKLSKLGSDYVIDPTYYRSIVGALQYATITIVQHVPAQDQYAYILTKPLSPLRFLTLKDKLKVMDKSSVN